MATDIVLQFMEKHNLPRDRETYLYIAYFGSPPDEIDAEVEAEMPREFRSHPEQWEDSE